MLKVLATLPEAKHFRQINNKGDRCQWVDRASDNLRVLCDSPDPWEKEWGILLRLEQGKTRAGITYPKRLNLLCLPPEPDLQPARILRDRWSGNFAHSCGPTLLHFDFPAVTPEGHSWLMYSVIAVAKREAQIV